MAIEWRDCLSFNNDLIDQDHRRLFSLINRTEDLLSSDQPMAELHDVINQLWKYTQDHFGREERIMIDTSYAKYDQHKKAHGELIEQLRICTQPLKEMGDQAPAKTGKLPKAIRDGLTGLLRHWIVDHILKVDLELRPLLAHRPKDYAP